MARDYREVQLLGFRGWIEEPWSSSIPLKDLLPEIGQAYGMVVKMRANRAIKVRENLHLKEEFPQRYFSWSGPRTFSWYLNPFTSTAPGPYGSRSRKRGNVNPT